MIDIQTPAARMRKEPLKSMKMQDIKIEFVDVCVVPVPADTYNIFDFDSDSASGSPSTPVEVVSVSDASPGSSSSSSEPARPRKRAKLDHMSPDEKAQHRKMMNRISAQSARDRQKALMVKQDSNIKKLQTKNEDLAKKNQELTSTNNDLKTENQTLKDENKRMSSLVLELEAKLTAAAENSKLQAVVSAPTHDAKRKLDKGMKLEDEQESNICCGSPSEPAVLRTIPLQKGSLEPQQSWPLLLVLWMLLSLGTRNPQQQSCQSWQTFQKNILANNGYQDLISLTTQLQKQLAHKWPLRTGLSELEQRKPD